MNLFSYVDQKKNLLFDCLNLDKLILLFGKEKQRDAFQFNRHSTIRFVFLSIVLISYFYSFFQVFIAFLFVLN